MIKNLLKFLNKNIIVINFLLVLFLSIFFIINKDKFDTNRTYLTFNFQERNWLLKKSNNIYIRNYLSDLQFSSGTYETNDLKKNINMSIDIENQKINFNFDSKRSKFLNWQMNSDDSKIDSINYFIDQSLNIYHKNLKENLITRKENLIENLRGYEISDKTVLAIEKMNQLTRDMFLIEESLGMLLDGKKIIVNRGYNIKYRRLFLNTDEYVISCLIFIFLFNFILKNFRSIIN